MVLRERSGCGVIFTHATDAEAVGARPRRSAALRGAVPGGEAGPYLGQRVVGPALGGLDLCKD